MMAAWGGTLLSCSNPGFLQQPVSLFPVRGGGSSRAGKCNKLSMCWPNFVEIAVSCSASEPFPRLGTQMSLPRTPSDAQLRGRFHGCLLGGAAGDALGAPVEFLDLEAIVKAFGEGGIRDYVPVHG